MRRGDFTELLQPTPFRQLLSGCVVRAQHQHRHIHLLRRQNRQARLPASFSSTVPRSIRMPEYICARPERLLADPARSGCPESPQAVPLPNYVQSGPGAGQSNGGWSTGECNSADRHRLRRDLQRLSTSLKSTSNPINWDQRLDWNISARDLATFRVDYQHVINTFPAPFGPDYRRNRKLPGHNQSYLSENFMLSETHTFSHSLINEFRFGFNWGNDRTCSTTTRMTYRPPSDWAAFRSTRVRKRRPTVNNHQRLNDIWSPRQRPDPRGHERLPDHRQRDQDRG